MTTNPEKEFTIATEASEACGSVSYWRASGTVPIADVQAAWQAAGLDMVLFRDAPAPETALRRAVLDLATREQINDKTERRTLVRPCKEPSTWAVVEEFVAEGLPPSYTTLAVVSFAGTSSFAVATVNGSQAQVDNIEQRVRAAFHAQQGLFAPEDVTGWLVKLAYARGAVTLRDSGGVYFIPRPAMDFWNKAAGAIESASKHGHRVFRIPAMRNSEAVEAIIDAITQEAEAEAKKIDEEIMAGLGDRALETRKGRIADLLAKVSSYEELVGREMKIRERLETLQASVATAKLIASAPAEEGAVA